MTRPPMWRRYGRLFGPDVRADVDDELRYHLDMRAQELIDAGMPRESARAASGAMPQSISSWARMSRW